MPAFRIFAIPSKRECVIRMILLPVKQPYRWCLSCMHSIIRLDRMKKPFQSPKAERRFFFSFRNDSYYFASKELNDVTGVDPAWGRRVESLCRISLNYLEAEQYTAIKRAQSLAYRVQIYLDDNTNPCLLTRFPSAYDNSQ